MLKRLLQIAKLPDLSKRDMEPELMDLPDSDHEELLITLNAFPLLNALFSRNRYLAKKFLLADIKKRGLQSVTIVDLGAGIGDFALFLASSCKRLGVIPTIICLDSDQRVAEAGKIRTKNVREIRFIQQNALRFDLASVNPHYITGNHFLHHLTEDEMPRMLKKSLEAASCGVFFNDLIRSQSAYLLYSLFIKLFLNRGFLFEDGRRSIRRGFTMDEMCNYINRAGIKHPFFLGNITPARIYLFLQKS